MSTRARATSMRAIRHGQQRTQLARILQWLYGAGEQGIAVPDLTPGNGFLFQDSAGTTPVTAYEQPVGRIVDRSGRGNHLIQATSTKRPTLSARYNLLQRTEEFDNSYWVKFSSATVTTNTGVAPDGTNTADTLTFGSGATSSIYNSLSAPSAAYVFSVYIRSATAKSCRLNVYTGSVDVFSPDLAVTSSWQRFTLTSTSAITSVSIKNQSAGGVGAVEIWGADLRRTIDTIGQPAYQRVGASNDYDTAGFYPYLAFDGTDDSMATAASVDFTGTDKMTVFAGVTKLSDAARGMVVELTNNAANSFQTNAPSASLGDFSFLSRGSVLPAAVQASPFSAPFNAVVACAADIAAPSQQIRLNGTLRAQNSDTQGTGNYSNSTLFVGARNNNALFFNGRLYPFFIRGAATDAGLIAQVEQYIKGRMPVNF